MTTRPGDVLVPATAATTRDRRYTRIRRGQLVDHAEWTALRREGRHLVLVHAVAQEARTDKVFSHHSAAAVWGLPVLGQWPDRVQHCTPPGSRGRAPGATRRRTSVPFDPVMQDGVLVTGPVRTVTDLARQLPLERVLCAADDAVRRGLCTPEQLAAMAAEIPAGGRGRQMAALVARLVDGRADSPGESLSRAQMYLLGVNRPDLQVELRDETGALVARSDFGWDGVVGEFDGRVKYRTGGDGLASDSAERAVFEEKVREDRIRATGRRVARWIWSDAWDGLRMLRVLRQAGVPFGEPWF